MSLSGIQKKVIGAAAVLTASTALIGYWYNFGWMTPAGHDASTTEIEQKVEVSNQSVLNAIKGLSTKVDVNQAEWKCDENTEELIELLQAQAVTHSVERQVKIDAINRKMGPADLNCSRFED